MKNLAAIAVLLFLAIGCGDTDDYATMSREQIELKIMEVRGKQLTRLMHARENGNYEKVVEELNSEKFFIPHYRPDDAVGFYKPLGDKQRVFIAYPISESPEKDWKLETINCVKNVIHYSIYVDKNQEDNKVKFVLEDYHVVEEAEFNWDPKIFSCNFWATRMDKIE